MISAVTSERSVGACLRNCCKSRRYALIVLGGAERVRKLARNSSIARDVVSSIALSSSLCQITRKTAQREELAHMQTNGLQQPFRDRGEEKDTGNRAANLGLSGT